MSMQINKVNLYECVYGNSFFITVAAVSEQQARALFEQWLSENRWPKGQPVDRSLMTAERQHTTRNVYVYG